MPTVLKKYSKRAKTCAYKNKPHWLAEVQNSRENLLPLRVLRGGPSIREYYRKPIQCVQSERERERERAYNIRAIG